MGVGCIALCPVDDCSFVGINCKKGRGWILPGGGLECNTDGRPLETLKQCAEREFREETGLRIGAIRWLFGAPNIDPVSGIEYYVHTFIVTKTSGSIIREGVDLGSGPMKCVNWVSLLESQFQSYYECLRDAYHTYRGANKW